MVDKKLSEFPDVSADDIAKLICLYLDENNAIKNGKVDFSTLDALLAHKSGDETFTGNKTFSGDTIFSGQATFNQTINANISGNAGSVTNGVYTTGNQTIAGTKTFSSTISGSITGNAGTVTNGVYTNTEQTISGNKTFSGSVSLNGTLSAGSTVKQTIVGLGIPDYSAGISISSGYVAVSNGYVVIVRGGGSSKVYLYVDGIQVDSNESNTSNEGGSLSAYIKKGSKATWSNSNISGTPKFFPCIGG